MRAQMVQPIVVRRRSSIEGAHCQLCSVATQTQALKPPHKPITWGMGMCMYARLVDTGGSCPAVSDSHCTASLATQPQPGCPSHFRLPVS